MKLTPTQERAAGKLTNEWQCAYALRESTATLRALHRKHIAERRVDSLGSMFSPRTAAEYRLARADDTTKQHKA